MQTIILLDSKSLWIPNHIKLFQGETNADYLKILIPQEYNSINLAECNIRLTYVENVDEKDIEHSFLIDDFKQEELYKDHFVYLINITTQITSIAGEVTLYLTITKNINNNDVLVLKSSTTNIYVSEHPGEDDYTIEELQILDQVVLTSTQAMEIAQSVRDDANNGVFNGKDYVIAPEDYAEIARLVPEATKTDNGTVKMATEEDVESAIAGSIAVSPYRLVMYVAKKIKETLQDIVLTGSFSHNRRVETEIGTNSATLGNDNVASKEFAVAIGNGNEVSGHAGTALGETNKVSGLAANAVGLNNNVASDFAQVVGNGNTIEAGAVGGFSRGANNTVSGQYAGADGFNNKSQSAYGIVSGYGNTNTGESSDVHGNNNNNSGLASSVGGMSNTNSANFSNIEGNDNSNSGLGSDVEGISNANTGSYSDVKGNGNKNTNGVGARISGVGNIATNSNGTDIRGYNNTSNNAYTDVSGTQNVANGLGASVHGSNNTSDNEYNATFGTNNTNNSKTGAVFGNHNKATSDAQLIGGEYCESDAEAVFILGNGYEEDGIITRSNAFKVSKDGVGLLNDLKLPYMKNIGTVCSSYGSYSWINIYDIIQTTQKVTLFFQISKGQDLAGSTLVIINSSKNAIGTTISKTILKEETYSNEENYPVEFSITTSFSETMPWLGFFTGRSGIGYDIYIEDTLSLCDEIKNINKNITELQQAILSMGGNI